MGETDILDLISDLKAEGEAFALATVVRTVAATSAKAGAKAVIRSDGTISEGWIGGGCAKGAVIKIAQEVIHEGTPRLLSLQPEDLLDEHGVSSGDIRDGVCFARNMCPSEGTMDIFVEPVLPRPELVICGASPVAVALASLAGTLGFSRTICAHQAEQHLFEQADRRINGFQLDTNDTRQRFIVIATQGRGDMAALKAGLTAEKDYLAFIGSRKKAEILQARLIDEGTDEIAFDKLKAPAGLDLKAITPEEIALSILAEIVQVRRNLQQNALQAHDRTK